MPPAELSNVAYVILGFLANFQEGPMSGYDIKQWIDKSVRFFFAASYGQIYPELKKLAQAGLVVGEEDAESGRARTGYTITDSGRAALRDWLLENDSRIEMRDQGILRIFFAESLTTEERIAKIAALRDERAAQLAVIEAIEVPPEDVNHVMPDLVLDYGLGLHKYVIEWCDRAIAKLENP